MISRDNSETVALLATAGTLANMVAVLGRSIDSVVELQCSSQWNDANLTIFSFETQLGLLRSALVKISEWIDAHYSEDPHHQLVMDLDRCVACCRLLINKVDADMQPLQMSARQMDKKHMHKVKTLLNSKDFINTQRMIEQQTNALTLLLTACNTTMLSQQQAVLGKPHARKMFKKMEDDAASMFVHLDTDSRDKSTAATTIRSSKRSLKFEFDKELLVSKIYDRWIRGSVKKSLRNEQPPKHPGGAFELEAEERGCLGVVSETGSYSASQRPMPELQGSDPGNGTQSYCTSSSLHAISELESPYDIPNPRTQSYDSNIVSELEGPYGTDTTQTPAARQRGFSLRKMHVPSRTSNVSDNMNSSIRAKAKIMQCDYKAVLVGSESKLDIFHAISAKHTPRRYAEQNLINIASTGALEAPLQLGKRSIHLINIGDVTGEWHEWQPLFASAAFLLFVVDLDTYDEGDKMKMTITLFEEIVKSKFFMKASVVLILNNNAGFREKLKRKALSDCFPDYIGGSDYHKAAEYMLWKFNMLNRGRFIMYPCMAESGDHSGLDSMSSIMKQAVINYVLRDAKLLA